ncbi:MAG: ThaI family type II restriction endonuclease [Nitrososphaerota archaeon]
MISIVDPIIAILKGRPGALRILGGAWDIFYVEGRALDVGKRRENFFKLLLAKEFGLEVRSAPSTERGWDISVIIEGCERKYSIKTAEDTGTLKIAWNGFPSIERARTYRFEAPLLYIMRNRSENEVSVSVFDLDDIKRLRDRLGDNFWWIPRGGTNPRGFGLTGMAVKELLKAAKEKGNYVAVKYTPIDVEMVAADYWEGWYRLVKELALKPYKPK